MAEVSAGHGGRSADGPPHVTWLDVAPLLQRAAAAMEAGDLLHGDTFSLFEAVSAVEIGALLPLLPIQGVSPAAQRCCEQQTKTLLL